MAVSPGKRPTSSMPSKTSPPKQSWPDRRLYGRAGGRPLTARRQALVDARLAELSLPDAGTLDPGALIPGRVGYALEIGFGGGEHLVGQAVRRPDWGFIGVETFLEGVAKALAHVDEADVGNVRIHRGDGRDIIERAPDASLDEIYVLFPDPWPKPRHWKRRIVEPGFIDQAARTLKPGGRLRVATDVKSYLDWTLFHVRQNAAFAWSARGAADWRSPPADHVSTRYETKNIGNCPPTFLNFVREEK